MSLINHRTSNRGENLFHYSQITDPDLWERWVKSVCAERKNQELVNNIGTDHKGEIIDGGNLTILGFLTVKVGPKC